MRMITIIVLLASVSCAHRQEPVSSYIEVDGFRYHALERDPRYQEAFQKADAILEAEFKDRKPQLGLIHEYWLRRKEILLKEFGIIWNTPAELNPDMNYD